MGKVSAGLLMYRLCEGTVEALLIHPGGPFWKNKDEGAWSIPKGEVIEGEPLEDAARREFQEELGIPPADPLLSLGTVKQKSGKLVHAWAFEGDCDPRTIRSNTFTLEWPPKSGKLQQFSEADRAQFFDLATAKRKINPAQVAFLDRLAETVAPRTAQGQKENTR